MGRWLATRLVGSCGPVRIPGEESVRGRSRSLWPNIEDQMRNILEKGGRFVRSSRWRLASVCSDERS